MILLGTVKKIPISYLIALALFIIPFFWFSPGAVDLGGDGNRLYFYDPVSFIKNVSLYSIDSEGKGNVEQRHAYLFYVGFIALLKIFIQSPHILIAVFNGLKLSLGFLSVYFIVKELLSVRFGNKKNIITEVSSILPGLFYILSTGSERLGFFWAKALHSHDQIFLNPFMFFLMLRFLLTKNRWYLWSLLFVSLIFSLDVSMNSAPPVFAFYPIAFAFLFLYVRFVRSVTIPVKNLITGAFIFLGLQAFHLIPSIAALVYPGSIANSIVFNESVSGGVNYFMSVRGLGKASLSFFIPPPAESFRWTAIMPPLAVIVGFMFLRKKRSEILLTSLFFFITFFLVSANITDIGLEFYRRLFYIPGFSMFRNFSSQWAYLFLFFYALLFGLSLSEIFSRLKHKYILATIAVFAVLSGLGYWQLFTGGLVDRVIWGSNNVKSAFIIDPRYEQTIAYIKSLPDEGKMLMLPLTDNFNQVIYGTNNAAYVGPSTISILTPKKTFGGYQIFYPNPIPETIMKWSREKNYAALLQIFSLFNIRYIFYNSDPKIYEEKFPQFPNSYMMTSLPKTQKEYMEFIKKFPVQQIYQNGSFQIFEFTSEVYRPEVYVPDSIYESDETDTVTNNTALSYKSAFVDHSVCEVYPAVCNESYKPPQVSITVQKISPVRYELHITQSESLQPYILVFQNSFHKDWKISLDNKVIKSQQHFTANLYANAWMITPLDYDNQSEYTMTLTLETQKYFQIGLVVSGVSLMILFFLIIKNYYGSKV